MIIESWYGPGQWLKGREIDARSSCNLYVQIRHLAVCKQRFTSYWLKFKMEQKFTARRGFSLQPEWLCCTIAVR